MEFGTTKSLFTFGLTLDLPQLHSFKPYAISIKFVELIHRPYAYNNKAKHLTIALVILTHVEVTLYHAYTLDHSMVYTGLHSSVHY